MNAPLIIPGANDFSETQHDQSYNPYVYDQGYDFDARHGYDDNYRDDDFYEPQQRKPRKTKKRNGKYRHAVRNSATVSLSALLDNLEAFIKRTPDVNLLCGAPVDLYQLYTETCNRGGFDAVCQAKQWRQIFRQLPQYSSTHTSASYALKKMYKKNLSDYEAAQRTGAAGF